MNINKADWNFTMTIQLHLEMCPKTGQPFIISSNNKPEYIDINNYIIPELFRKWCKYKGTHFQAYLLELDNEYHTTMNVKGFLENFPEWCDIKDHNFNNWTEEDHNEFKQVVEYLAERPGYILCWNH